MLPVSAADLLCQVTTQLLILAGSFSVHNLVLSTVYIASTGWQPERNT
jgi:hypothetical protein